MPLEESRHLTSLTVSIFHVASLTLDHLLNHFAFVWDALEHFCGSFLEPSSIQLYEIYVLHGIYIIIYIYVSRACLLWCLCSPCIWRKLLGISLVTSDPLKY